ncbi:MAG TPA: dihydrodipicolinate reductase C-terminal domain-containing protein [Spirochaetales bacterium]|nr:dihydrodipicolinate reductase C-terminal domain-containing protein [Spirochaetales bacterium]HRY54320.1 dihydrodipicolinate reductase C-terminal domain-containing protein [Spirochaetia bacterium]
MSDITNARRAVQQRQVSRRIGLRSRNAQGAGQRATRLGIFGRGRLGSEIARAAGGRDGIELAWAQGRGGLPGAEVDAVVDASSGEAVHEHARWAIEHGADLVIAATGWEPAALEGLDLSGIGILVAPNLSLAAAFMRRAALALGRFAALDASSELSIVERHHRMKADSPSGTAKLLAAALAEGCPRYAGWAQGSAEPGRLSVASLRAGTCVGYHELRLESGTERLVLSHEALDRGVFAQGALRAVEWIRGRKGLYSFDDLAAEIMDRVFEEGTI